MSTHTVLCDGNYYLHRSFSVAASNRKLEFLKKNTLTLFLTTICQDLVELRATHALVVFDAPGCFRFEVYKDYKANRRKNTGVEIRRSDGTTVTLKETAGSFVKDARKVIELSGITHAYEKGYEGDDLLGCASISLPGRITVCTRDKDAAVLVNDRVTQYWPKEKRRITPKEVRKEFGIEPEQVRDYLCLLGDGTDNIPGVPDFGPVTARKLLLEHGSIANALKDDKWRARLMPHKKTLAIAKKLVTLRTDLIFKQKSLMFKTPSDELTEHVWSVPKALKDLGEARKMQTMKGLFG